MEARRDVEVSSCSLSSVGDSHRGRPILTELLTRPLVIYIAMLQGFLSTPGHRSVGLSNASTDQHTTGVRGSVPKILGNAPCRPVQTVNKTHPNECRMTLH